MKFVVSLVLISALLAILAAGCGGDDGGSSPITAVAGSPTAVVEP